MNSIHKYSRHRRHRHPDVMSYNSLELLKKIREYNMSGHIPQYTIDGGKGRSHRKRYGKPHTKRRKHSIRRTSRMQGGAPSGNSPELFVPYAQGSGSSSVSSNYSRLMSGLAQSRENGGV